MKLASTALGVQERGFHAYRHPLSTPGDVALALSVVLRIRELGCGIPGLLVWPTVEGRYLLEEADSYTEIRSVIEERLGKQIGFI